MLSVLELFDSLHSVSTMASKGQALTAQTTECAPTSRASYLQNLVASRLCLIESADTVSQGKHVATNSTKHFASSKQTSPHYQATFLLSTGQQKIWAFYHVLCTFINKKILTVLISCLKRLLDAFSHPEDVLMICVELAASILQAEDS